MLNIHTRLRTLYVAVAASAAIAQQAVAQRPDSPAAVKHYFDLVRPEFSGQKAFDQVAFMDKYFRWPGNTGFNASVHRVEDILKTAGYVEQSKASPSDVLTYRIEHRPIKAPAWDPQGASVTIVGENAPVLDWTTNRNMSPHDQLVLHAGKAASPRNSLPTRWQRQRRPISTKRTSQARSC